MLRLSLLRNLVRSAYIINTFNSIYLFEYWDFSFYSTPCPNTGPQNKSASSKQAAGY